MLRTRYDHLHCQRKSGGGLRYVGHAFVTDAGSSGKSGGSTLLMTLHLKLDVDDPTSREDVEFTRWIVTCGYETVYRSIGVGFVRRGSSLIFPF